MVFNLSKEKKLKQHFLRQSAFTVLSLATLEKLAHRKNGSKMDTFSTILQKALSRIPPPS